MRTQPRHLACPSGAHTFRLRTPVAASTALWLAVVALFAVSAAPARAAVPIATDDSAVTVENTTAYISVLDNDSDPDFEPIQVTDATQPAHGSVTCTSGGICMYLPDAGFTGQDAFGYDVSDGIESASADVVITVTPADPTNSPPTAVDDTVTTGSGQLSLVILLANDTDPDSDALQVNSAATPGHGTLDCSAAAYCLYTSDVGYSGPDSFGYVVADRRGGTDTGTVTLTVEPNHDPAAADDSLTTRADASARSLNVIANDTDDDGDPLTAELLAQSQHGNASCSGSFCEYTPAVGYIGADSFTYTASDGRGGTDTATVSVEVTVNHPPEAVDDEASAVQGTVRALSLLENDHDDDGDTIRLIDASEPAHGDVNCDDKGFCDYTSEAAYVGSDGFTYVISDGVDTATADVEITVTAPCPPAHCIDNGTIALAVRPHGHLNAFDGDGSVAGPGPVGLTFLPTGNDATASGCLCEGWGVADAGSGVTGYVSEDTDSGANGMSVDSFDFTDSTAESVVNIADTMRVTHDFHPSPQTENLYEIDVTIENLTGEQLDDIRYRRVTDWDVEPTAFSEYVTIEGGDADRLLFDSDHGFATANPLGERPSILATGDFVDSGPVDHGALFDFGFGALGAGDQMSFTLYYGAAATEDGAERALDAVRAEVYSLAQPDTEDGPTLGTPNTFVVGFTGVGGSPVLSPDAVDDELTTEQDVAGSIDVLANDSDPNDDELSVTTSSPSAEHGDVSCTRAGVCTYTPDAGFSGADSFTYAISDGNGGTDSANVEVEVVPVEPSNADPVATDDELVTDAGVAGSLDVLANDSDPDDDALSVTTPSPAAEHGDVSCTEAGLCTYTPVAGFSGGDSFEYAISDGKGGAAAATVVVSVDAVSGQLQLALSDDEVSAQYSDPVGPVTATTSGGGPVAETVLTATGLPAAVALTDHADGTADIAGVLSVGRGSYTAVVTATNGPDTAAQDLGVQVSPETAAVEYTGDRSLALPQGKSSVEASLSALVEQQADGSSGDITRARVYFDVYDSANSNISSPDITVGPVAPSDEGVADAAVELGAGAWRVVVRFDQSNDYFNGPSAEAAGLTISEATPGHKAFGAGWVVDPGPRKHHHHHHRSSWPGSQWPHATDRFGRFCFGWWERTDGSVDGAATYSFRGVDGKRYIFRSTDLNRVTFSVTSDGAISTAKGMGNVWVVDPWAGRHERRHVVILGRVWFRMDVTDGGPSSADRFALSIWKDGDLWHRVGTPGDPREVARGQIVVD